MPILRIWLYRVGICGTDANARRFMSSETWLSLSDPAIGTALGLVFRPFGQRLRIAFGSNASFDTHRIANSWSEELYPHPRLLEPPFLFPQVSPPQLNAGAPEAAVRLQRVGYTGTGQEVAGRLLLPILNDTPYTDLPHRRHVDASTLQTQINANLALQPLSFTSGGHTFYNVIFHRRTHTWTNVDHYRVSPKVSRVWQRFRTYNYGSRHVSDQAWSGPFF